MLVGLTAIVSINSNCDFFIGDRAFDYVINGFVRELVKTLYHQVNQRSKKNNTV